MSTSETPAEIDASEIEIDKVSQLELDVETLLVEWEAQIADDMKGFKAEQDSLPTFIGIEDEGMLDRIYALKKTTEEAYETDDLNKMKVEQMTAKTSDPKEQYTWDMCFVFKIGSPEKMIKHVVKKPPTPSELKKDPESKGTMEKLEEAEDEVFQRETARAICSLRRANLETMLFKSIQKDEIYCFVGANEERLKVEAARTELELSLDPETVVQICKKKGMQLAIRKAADDPAWQDLYGRFTEKDMKLGIYKTYNEDAYHPSSPFKHTNRMKLTHSIIGADSVLGGAAVRTRKEMLAKTSPIMAFYPLHHAPSRCALKAKMKKYNAVINPPLDDIANYFGEQVGVYFAFLSMYTRWLFVLASVGACFFAWQFALNDFDTAGNAIFGLFVVCWSTGFLETWKRKQCSLRCKWGMNNFHHTESARPEFEGNWGYNDVTGKLEEVFPWISKVWRALVAWLCIGTVMAVCMGAVICIFILRSTLALNGFEYFTIAITCGLLNSVQIMIFNILYNKLANHLNDWENHRTDTEHENSRIGKAFMFKIINSFFSLFYIAFARRFLDPLGRCRESYSYYMLRVPPGFDGDREFQMKQAVETWVRESMAEQCPEGCLLTDCASSDEFRRHATDALAETQKVAGEVYVSCIPSMYNATIDGVTTEHTFGPGALGAMQSAAVFQNYGGEEFSGYCLNDLSVQIISLFVTMIFIGNFLEIGIPFIKSILKGKAESKGQDLERLAADVAKSTGPAAKYCDELGCSDAEKEYLKVQYEGTFSDFDEMVVQFGYVVLFVMVFPIAPLLALINNIVEFQLDGTKLLTVDRRPHPRGAYSIGTWYDILLILTWVGVLTNVGLITLSSTLLEEWEWFPRLVVFLVAEHFLIFMKSALSYFIADEPEEITKTRARNTIIKELLR